MTDDLSGYGIADSPFLTVPEVTRLLRLEDAKHPEQACRLWLRRHAVPVVKRGRKLLVERRAMRCVLARTWDTF